MSNSLGKVITAMQRAVPPGLAELDLDARDTLQDLTALLLDACDDEDYQRYSAITQRRLPMDTVRQLAASSYAGQRVLVTGGTGCIGSELIRQLRDLGAAEIFCLYSVSNDFDPVPGVVYLDVDLRDERRTRRAVRSVQPDVIFHCAAQRSPWLAEREVKLTLMSNVLGTRNVLRAARDVNVSRFVHASTGKAMRYYTTDVYAATKKLAEWMVHDYAAEGRATGLARFTHVVDNAVVLTKVEEAMADPHGVMRVHDAETMFYAQSAGESAQLLLLAGLQSDPGLRALAIRDLGYPVGLVDLVVGRIRELDARRPIVYFSGYDQGYERGTTPGLYDPENAAELSPLINAVEAPTAAPLPEVPTVDTFALALPLRGRGSAAVCDAIESVCRGNDPMTMRAELARAAALQAEVMFRQCPEALFRRLDSMARRAHVALPTRRHRAQAA